MRDEMIFYREVCDWLRKKDPIEFAILFEQIERYMLDDVRPLGYIPEEIMILIDKGIETAKKNDREIHRKTPEYRSWRAAVLTRDDFTCQICGQVGGTLNAHHIKQFAYYPDLRFDVNNGVTLCKKCHVAIHKLMREKGMR